MSVAEISGISGADERPALAAGRTGLLRIAWRFRSAKIGVGILGLLFVVAFVGPYLAPHSPTAVVGVPYGSPSGAHLLGTDFLGRDVLSRFLSGGRAIMLLPLLATAVGFSVGIVLGLVTGYGGKVVDAVGMRIVDVVLSFPGIILVLLLLTAFGSKIWVLVLGVAIATFPGVARIVRGAALEVATREFIEVAVARGEGRWTIMFREILPNLWTPVIAAFGVYVPTNVVLIASLSYLGFGIQPPTADWALMINENSAVLSSSPLVLVAPIVAIALLTISVNLIGDALARAAGRSGVTARRGAWRLRGPEVVLNSGTVE